MKLRLKLSVVLLIIICMVKVNVSTASESNQSIDLNRLNDSRCEQLIKEIVSDIVYEDTESFKQKAGYFTSECYYKLESYIERGSIDSEGIVSNVTDTVNVNDSATGDTVIMVNLKLGFDNDKYNKLYLIELHINAGGDIYGYNIWAY